MYGQDNRAELPFLRRRGLDGAFASAERSRVQRKGGPACSLAVGVAIAGVPGQLGATHKPKLDRVSCFAATGGDLGRDRARGAAARGHAAYPFAVRSNDLVLQA